MRLLIFKALLAIASLIFGFGGVMHAIAYRAKALASLDASNLAPFLGSELKVLWLADSTTLIALAVVVGTIALKPQSASRTVIMSLALMPAATALLLYEFLGGFYAGHMLMAASAMVFAAGFLAPSSGS
jgi:hypothetical protein